MLLLEPDQISHMVAKRGRKLLYPMWKKKIIKHSVAEYQSIKQFWLQLDVVP